MKDNKLYCKSYLFKKELLEINIAKKKLKIYKSSFHKKSLKISLKNSFFKINFPKKKNHLKTIKLSFKCKLKKISNKFFTPKTIKSKTITTKVPFLVNNASIEYPAKEQKMPKNTKQFIPLVKKKYPLIKENNILFYKYYPKVDMAKLSNFRFEENELILKLNFSIKKTKYSTLLFFIDKKEKITRFISLSN